MALPKNNPWRLKDEPGKRLPFFPCHRADFSNLEELLDILIGPDDAVAATGQTTNDPRFPNPHVTVWSQRSKHSYQFIKLDNETYALRVIDTSSPADGTG